jgi:hypothetical protein
MRVQRTRLLLPAVARRSPLTRGPLGGPKGSPNMRMQRTRLLLPAVVRRSPLTRRPLGGLET